MSEYKTFNLFMNDLPDASYQAAATDVFDVAELCIEWCRLKDLPLDIAVRMAGLILEHRRRDKLD